MTSYILAIEVLAQGSMKTDAWKKVLACNPVILTAGAVNRQSNA